MGRTAIFRPRPPPLSVVEVYPMTSLRRLATGGLATMAALAVTSLPAYAATKRAIPTPKPVAPVQVKSTLLPPASTVQVGGRPATTVQATDTYHMLVKLPDNLAQGSYSIEVTNEAGTTTASDELVVDNPGFTPSNMLLLSGGGLLILLVLVMRLARTPGLA